MTEYTDLLSSEGTDPALSNEIADVVSRVIRQTMGEDFYVMLNLRYGIAHELQRAGLCGPEHDRQVAEQAWDEGYAARTVYNEHTRRIELQGATNPHRTKGTEQ